MKDYIGSYADFGNKCPMGSHIALNCGEHVHVKETACKKWMCKVCKKKLRALFVMRVIHGCSMLGGFWLITLTYRAKVPSDLRDAASVRGDQRRLLASLKQSGWTTQWLKVIELTKRGQVHLHLIFKRQQMLATCRTTRETYVEWFERKCRGNCAAHHLSWLWLRITGDSFVVDVSPGRSAGATGSYLAKYLWKGFGERSELKSRGFTRRWTSSRDFPRLSRMQLRGTLQEAWKWTTMTVAKKGWNDDQDCWTLQPAGEAYSVAVEATIRAASRASQEAILRAGFVGREISQERNRLT